MTVCYGHRADTEKIFSQPSSVIPCPSGEGCCFDSDICLSNNICLGKSAANATASYSGYYIGSCTDPTYTSPYCPKECTSKTSFSVVYNYTTSQWACCSGNYLLNTVRCDVPTDETFYAPSPEKLIRLTTSVRSSPTSPPSTTPTSASAVTTTSTASSNGTTYSPGATAGIAIGTAFSLVLLIAISGWLGWLYRRKHHPSQGSQQPYHSPTTRGGEKIFIHSWRGPRVAEADDDRSMSQRRNELASERVYEAPSHGISQSSSTQYAGNHYQSVRSEELPK